MKNLVFIAIYLFSGNLLLAQDIFKGNVLDAVTDLHLPYVNIGFIDRGIGTVSDENGQFYLDIVDSKVTDADTLLISSVGYKSIKIPYPILKVNSNDFQTIKMEPELFKLDEIVLSAKRAKTKYAKNKSKIVGYSFISKNKQGEWEGDGALGGELVTKIRVTKNTRKLNTFYFHVLSNLSDSLLMRINIYKGNTYYPEVKITSQNILYMINIKQGKAEVDLSSYDLYVEDDFSIGLELLKVYGDEVGLILASDNIPGLSYRRYASQGIWKRYLSDAMTYFLSTTVIGDDNKVASESEAFLSRPQNGIINSEDSEGIAIINGIVFNNGKAIPNVDVINNTNGQKTLTDDNGRYRLPAQVGDEIEFNYAGMQVIRRSVLETTFAINASMEVKIEELENVTVTSKKTLEKTQKQLFADYNFDTGVIKSAFGMLYKDNAGYSMEIVDEKDLPKSATNILEAIQGKFPGVRISPKGNPLKTCSPQELSAVIYLRAAFGSIKYPQSAVFEVDGILYTDPPFFLDVANIKRIAKIPGNVGTVKYGSVAAGGLFIINTKTGNFSPRDKSAKLPLLGGSSNLENAISEEQVRLNWPEYLSELYASETIKEATDVNKKYWVIYQNRANYLIDIYHYFIDRWPQSDSTRELMQKVESKFLNDSAYLKALAYVLDKSGNYLKSNELYKKIMILEPNKGQSYRDLGNSYTVIGALEKAANIYARYKKLLNEDYFRADVEGIQQIMDTEFNTLLNIYSTTHSDSRKKIGQVLEPEKNRKRILFEWNDDSAALDLQFVSPDKNVTTWSTSIINSNSDDQSGKTETSREFFIYEDFTGKWQLNLKYRGNRSGLPAYLKVTVSTNYGSPEQQNQTEMYRLDVKNVYRKLMEISSSYNQNN